MNVQPLVSVIVRNYNYGRYLRGAIDSALHQTYANTEIVVVDDGSTDDSREIIASYGDRVVPLLKENGGQASAWNAGFEVSRGDIICFLDSDDLFTLDKVNTVVGVFERHPDIGSCFHPLKLVDAACRPLPRPMDMGLLGERDFRASIKNGKLPYIAPATSGLCFKHSLLRSIFPTPEIDGDHYVKFTSLLLAKTYFSAEELALQRIHGDNFYTAKSNPRSKARHYITTSYWMHERFPESTKWADNVFANGMANYWKAGGIDEEYKGMVKKYLSSLSPVQRIKMSVWILYHRLTE